MAMRKTGYITILLTGFLATLLLGSCSTDDVAELPLEEGVQVRFEIKRDGIMSRAPGDAALSVNRILILPFRKTDEASSNDAANFIPEYSAARQLDVNSFPAVVTMLTLSAASTYQLLVIGVIMILPVAGVRRNGLISVRQILRLHWLICICNRSIRR